MQEDILEVEVLGWCLDGLGDICDEDLLLPIDSPCPIFVEEAGRFINSHSHGYFQLGKGRH